jgi:hypothetical protein
MRNINCDGGDLENAATPMKVLGVSGAALGTSRRGWSSLAVHRVVNGCSWCDANNSAALWVDGERDAGRGRPLNVGQIYACVRDLVHGQCGVDVVVVVRLRSFFPGELLVIGSREKYSGGVCRYRPVIQHLRRVGLKASRA